MNIQTGSVEHLRISRNFRIHSRSSVMFHQQQGIQLERGKGLLAELKIAKTKLGEQLNEANILTNST